MLLQLSIHHLALINDMTIDFEPGMNVMPGEGENGEDLVGIGRCGRAEAACPISVGAVSPWQG